MWFFFPWCTGVGDTEQATAVLPPVIMAEICGALCPGLYHASCPTNPPEPCLKWKTTHSHATYISCGWIFIDICARWLAALPKINDPIFLAENQKAVLDSRFLSAVEIRKAEGWICFWSPHSSYYITNTHTHTQSYSQLDTVIQHALTNPKPTSVLH